MYVILEYYSQLNNFLVSGGFVLKWFIVPLTFAMWTAIFERLWYYRGALRKDVNGALSAWESRSERQSWAARQIRRALISRVTLKINNYLPMIKTMVALCPLMGLLGTVTGMIEVFNIMAVTGGGDAKSMAGGVSKATIPTMAGMVAALSGVFAMSYLEKVAQTESQLLADHLTTDH
ncbi:MAG: MotA/TolQ/ExbB proton channel family protein [Pseudomonadales bacterium]